MNKKIQNKLGYRHTNPFGPTTIKELNKEFRDRKKDEERDCHEYEDSSSEILRCIRTKEAERDKWYRENKKRIIEKNKEIAEREINEEILQEQMEAVLPKLEDAEETSPRSGGLVSELAGGITNLWNKFPIAMKLVNMRRKAEAKAEVTPSELADAIAGIARECVNNPTDDGYEEIISEDLSFGTDAMAWEADRNGKHPLAKRQFMRAVGAIDSHMKRFTIERVKNYKAASIETIGKMVKLANTLDQKGYVREADYLDHIIKNAAKTNVS